MTFQQYYDLLQSAAQRYDETISNTKKSYRYVYMYEQTYEDEQPPSEDENIYDIATPVDLVQTNFHYSTRQDCVKFPTPQNNNRPPTDT